MTTLALVLKKIESVDKSKYDTFYLYSKAETKIDESETDDIFESIYTTNISNIGKSSGWIIDSVIEHDINISMYNLLVDGNYINYQKD